MDSALRIVAARTGACLLVAIAAALAHAQTFTPVAAVWKERHVDFVYQGRTARYSCEGLRDKVRAMLLDLGARRDLKVSATGCGDGSAGPALRLVFSAPVLVEKAARTLRAGDAAATDARFQSFTISNDAFRNLGLNDCELVEEFARQILPKLTTRALKQDVTCVAAPNGSRFLVRGEILKSLPGAQFPASALR